MIAAIIFICCIYYGTKHWINYMNTQEERLHDKEMANKGYDIVHQYLDGEIKKNYIKRKK